MLVDTYLVYSFEQSAATLSAMAAFLARHEAFVWEEHKKHFDDKARLIEHSFKYHYQAKLGCVNDAKIWFSLLFNLPSLADDPSRKIQCHALIPISDDTKRIRSSVQINGALLRISVLEFYPSGLTRTSQVVEIRPQTQL